MRRRLIWEAKRREDAAEVAEPPAPPPDPPADLVEDPPEPPEVGRISPKPGVKPRARGLLRRLGG